MTKYKHILYLSKGIFTVTIKRESLVIKGDVMPFSIYGAGPIAFFICTAPTSSLASTIMMKA